MATVERTRDPEIDAHGRAAIQVAAADALAGMRDIADEIAHRIPDAATATRSGITSTRSGIEAAARRIATGSDEQLTAGSMLSIGLAIGLLVGGAHRLVVALALLPAAAMGMTLLDRRGDMGHSTTRAE